MPIVYTFSDNSTLEFAQGNFDGWCVYLTRPNASRYAPTDIEYFTFFKNLIPVYGEQMIMNVFEQIYNSTTKTLSTNMFTQILNMCQSFKNHVLDTSIYFSIMYMGMIAEEQKAFTKLGKRVKRLGFYQVIKLKYTPVAAANFSKGKKWKDIDKICNNYGF